MIDIILGPDRLLAMTTLKKLAAERDPDGQNTDRYDADSDPIEAAINAIATPSFFGQSRLVIATGYLARTRQTASRGGAKAKKPKAGDGQAARSPLERLLELAASTGALILFDPGSSSIPLAISNVLPEGTSIHHHQPPRGQQLIDFVIAEFQQRNASIDRPEARLLLDRLYPGQWQQGAANPAYDQPPDLETLVSEIEKLSLAAGLDGITEDLVQALTPAADAERLFPFLDAVLSGHTSSALRELESASGAEDERQRLLAQLFQQIEYAGAASAPDRPRDPLQAGRDLGMSNPNRMKSVLRAMEGSSLSPATLARIATESDRRLKRGLDSGPDDVLYRLLGAAQRRRGQ